MRHKAPTCPMPQGPAYDGNRIPLAHGNATAGPRDPFQRTPINESHTLSLGDCGSCLQSRAVLVLKKKKKKNSFTLSYLNAPMQSRLAWRVNYRPGPNTVQTENPHEGPVSLQPTSEGRRRASWTPTTALLGRRDPH